MRGEISSSSSCVCESRRKESRCKGDDMFMKFSTVPKRDTSV